LETVAQIIEQRVPVQYQQRSPPQYPE